MAAKLRTAEFVVCEVHLLELRASVRAAIHRREGPIPEQAARRVINRFDRAVNRKMFQRKRLEGDEALNMARSLGEAHGWKERHTAFDLWHLAAAWALSAGVFLTFDKRQKRIAGLLGMA
jgi:predicted nucleic acid-binding protein